MGLLGWGGTGKEPAMHHHRSHGRCSVVSSPACSFALQPTAPPRPPQVEAAKEARLKGPHAFPLQRLLTCLSYLNR